MTGAIHKGWHGRGYLPHFDSPDTVQFVTFRLADSLPREVYRTLAAQTKNIKALRRLTEDRLDEGRGQCWLARPEIADMMRGALFNFDGERYQLQAWVIMPNHVHALVRQEEGHRLGDIVGSWKSFVAKQANTSLARSGTFWAADYFDRVIRDDAHYIAALAYIENNPVKAGLAPRPQDWPWSSSSCTLEEGGRDARAP
jgi:REP element-mobilizing transposase RayT